MRAARWLLGVFGAASLSIALAVPAFAHPLGNFTINRFSELQADGDRISVLYVVDYAEIPAFQERQRMADDGGYRARQVVDLSDGLQLQVDGHRLPLAIKERSFAFLPGQAGLQTLRVQILLTAPLPSGDRLSATYRDGNFSGRLGWKEIVVKGTGGATVLQSTVPSTSVSHELRAYPQDMLSSPLNVTEASFTFRPGLEPSGADLRLPAVGPLGIVRDRFAALITPSEISIPLFAFSLLAATALGALHALSPGHGKAVMAGYLVGTQSKVSTAVGLGLAITATHTAGVFALGLVTLYAASMVTPERLYPWLTLLSGLLVIALGATLVWSRARLALHGHDHVHPSHSHIPKGPASLIGLGISGGLIPCPSALVVLLAAISIHRLLFGMLLIVAFSAGLAAVLTGIGIALATGLPLVTHLHHVASTSLTARITRLLPIGSALIVTIAGLALTAQAIPTVR